MGKCCISSGGGILCIQVEDGLDALLQVADIEYLGAFRMPEETANTKFGFRSGTIAYNPSDDSLFVNCGSQSGTDAAFSRVCKVSIPALSLSGTIASLNRASIAIEAADVITGLTYNPAYGGNENDSGAPTAMHVFGSKLIFTCNQYYPNTDLLLSHGRCDLDLTNAEGMFRPNTGVNARYHNMGMCEIPAAFQDDFGGHTAIATRGGGSIVTNSSDGPAVMTFNSADVSATPFAATLRQRYTQGQLDPTSPDSTQTGGDLLWTWSNFINGGAIAFHSQGGKYGIAMFGTRAETAHWYGNGSYADWFNDVTFPTAENIPALKPGQSHYATFGNPSGWPATDDENRYYTDATGDNSKGTHGADLWTGIWLYDPADVLAGPELYSAQPYARGRLANPFNTVGDKYTGSGDYCPSNGRLYVPVRADTNGAEPVYLICVYQLPV